MELTLVENNKDYYEVIRLLRTDPNNTSGFLEQVEITPEQQLKYMEKYEKKSSNRSIGDEKRLHALECKRAIQDLLDEIDRKIGYGMQAENTLKRESAV